MYIDLADPKARAEAIANGLVWLGPTEAKVAACEDLASGRVPMPSTPIPTEWLNYLHSLPGGADKEPAMSEEGSGPA
jgi:hypothetical protein